MAGRKGKRPNLKIVVPEETPAVTPPRNLDKRTTITIGEKTCIVEADDLEKLCDIGRGAYGIVEKMRHVPSETIMAVKIEPEMNILEIIKETLMNHVEQFKSNAKNLECAVYPRQSGDRKENFCANIYNAEIRNHTNNIVISLIVKILPKNLKVRRYHNSENQFFNEVLMYQHIIPLFIKNYSFKDKNALTSLFPKYYYGNHTGESAMVVLEDLKVAGFTLGAGSNQLFDLEHCRVALQGLAHFHASSHSMKHEQQDNFFDTARALKEPRFNDVYRQRSNVYLQYTSLNTINIIKTSSDEKIVEFRTLHEEFLEELQKVLETPVAVLEQLVRPEEPLAVLCHADFYRNNMMFKYHEDHVTDVKLIDFQTVRYSNPAIDIVFLMHMNTTRELRRQHFRELLETYQKTLVDCLESMNKGSRSDWEDMLSVEVLLKDVERHALYGYIISTMFLHLLLATQEELEQNEELKKKEEDEVIPSQEYMERIITLGGTEALKRSLDIVQDMVLMDRNNVFSKLK